MEAIHFLEYDKISDTLMFFSPNVTLKFVVQLSRVKDNKRFSFHNEYGYNNKGYKAYSIKRNINCFFLIDDAENFDNGIMIRPQDVTLLGMVMQNSILPWIMGDTRVYGISEENKLILRGKYKKVDFPVSDYKFISFLPIVIDYNDNTSKEGIRMIINSSDNVVDINVNQFLEFYYYITTVDMYGAATNLLNYVKTQPYGMNMYDMVNPDNNNRDQVWNQNKKSQNDFFKNLK